MYSYTSVTFELDKISVCSLLKRIECHLWLSVQCSNDLLQCLMPHQIIKPMTLRWELNPQPSQLQETSALGPYMANSPRLS